MNAISTTSMHNMSHTSHYPELSAFSTHINEKSFLKGSIQQKFLVICLILIILMAASISAVYWELARRDKQQESQRRIQVAFDILLHEIVTYSETFVQGANDFLEDSLPIREATYMYYDLMGLHDAYDIVRQVAREYLVDVTTDLEKFAHIVAVHRLVLYGPDASIMAMYQQQDGQEIMGLSTISDAGNQTFLVLDNQEEAAQMLAGERPIPDQLFPLGVQTHFFDQIPEAASVKFFTEDQKLGLRITAPVYHEKEIVGVLVGDIFLTQKWIQQFAALSTTEINLFVGDHLSIGTFPAQEEPDPQATQTLTPHTAAELMKLPSTAHPIEVMSITVEEQEYYHAAYGLVDDHEIVSTIAISVSKATEKQEIRKVLGTILTISGVALVVAIVVSFVLSRRTMKAIDHLVHVIGAAASGNLKRTAPVMSRDEFGLLAVNLNAMIMRLRDVSTQTQAVAHTVTTTADNILGEVDSLFGLMEQQSSAVDNTVGAVERIDQFIDRVVADITELLDGTERILQSLQQMSMNTEAVANSTGYLNQDLHDISNFADQVSRASRQILAHADNLMTTIEETEAATHQINELLVEVAQNAEQSQEFAKETATAALEGQTSVDAAIEGIEALKEVVAQSAQIMQDVNKQSEQVSSILDIVDEITDKTTLLSLNASIISAQAGEHGRGFAVVADEIRELAEQTRSSTHEIGALITTLQRQAAQGVKSVMRGIEKADDGVRLSRDVKEALARINRWAARSLERSKHTVQVIQGTVTGSQAIHASMNKVTEMTAHIRSEIEQEERDLTQVVTSIENIQAMSTQVKHANIEQNAGAMEIETQMQVFTEKLTAISEQARLLQENSDQIVAAMRKLGGITESILQNTTTMSDHTVRSLVHQSDALREGLNVFKVA